MLSSVAANLKVEFEQDIETWIKEGILEPVPTDVAVKSVIPLMLWWLWSSQQKGRSDRSWIFGPLNEFVSSHPEGSADCDEIVREWQQSGQNIVMADLQKAYLQLRVD